MKLEIRTKTPGCADGTYRVRAKGCIAAALYWADGRGALPGWTAFAWVPVAPNGVGEFRFTGGRALPREASHVLVRSIRADMSTREEALEPLPAWERPPEPEAPIRLGLVSDLHLSHKPWPVRRALCLAEESDAVLCAGDMVNDGYPGQYALLREIMEQSLPAKPLLAVAGNHDYPREPVEGFAYSDMQRWLLGRAAEMGLAIREDESGAYAVDFHGLDIIGLNVAGPGRKLAFQKEGQLRWLERHLEETAAPWHILLCHTPPIAHNPQRGAEDTAYFSGNGQLQKIIDGHRNMLFLSGHTHVSFNCLKGCVEVDRERDNLYINAGSIRSTALKPEEPLQPEDWTEGNIVLLEIDGKNVEITAVSPESGRRIARGYYRYTPVEDRPEQEI